MFLCDQNVLFLDFRFLDCRRSHQVCTARHSITCASAYQIGGSDQTTSSAPEGTQTKFQSVVILVKPVLSSNQLSQQRLEQKAKTRVLLQGGAKCIS